MIDFRYIKGDSAIAIKEFTKHKAYESENLPFLDLIVCPAYLDAYKPKALNFYGLDKEQYKHSGQFSPVKNKNQTNLRKVFYEVSYDVDEIIKGIGIKTLDKEQPYVDIDFSAENYEKNIVITTKFWNTFGRCYSIIPTLEVQKLGIYNIIIESYMKVYVYFGHPGQFTSSNRNQKVFSIFMHFFYHVNVGILILSFQFKGEG